MPTDKKVVIITGASSGIGASLAEVFSANGYRVVLSARNKDKLGEIRSQIGARGGEAICIPADVSQENDCRKLIDETIGHFGRLDVLINNAGISMRAMFSEVDLDVIRKVMETNFWGTVYCTRYALPYLIKRKGSIVGISSIAGKKGLPGRTGYSASKFAMEGFLETVRSENINNGLHVLVACPGFTATNIRYSALSASGQIQAESPRDEESMMKPEQVAKFIFQAVRKKKRDLILTTNGKVLLFLNKFFPAMMDKMIYNHMSKEKVNNEK